jgi:hypothetical protein
MNLVDIYGNSVYHYICLNELCIDALNHVPECLEYLSLLNTSSVFQFCAIPQIMAIASISLFYNNDGIFKEKKMKIRKLEALNLIIQGSKNMETIKKTFMKYIQIIKWKNRQGEYNKYNQDNFLKMSECLTRIECWIYKHDEMIYGQSGALKRLEIYHNYNSNLQYWFFFLVLIFVYYILSNN